MGNPKALDLSRSVVAHVFETKELHLRLYDDTMVVYLCMLFFNKVTQVFLMNIFYCMQTTVREWQAKGITHNDEVMNMRSF